ncbi:MAG: alpha/beta hydrolase [Xanthomonadaceae bacterium]|nr:alpha/beta hydrolase [Xanthomonadaceae bacterium]
MSAAGSPRDRRIALPALSLAAQCWGDEGLPPLLAVHGWLDNAGSFARLAPRLAARHHVIALDLPGHGHSDHLAEGASYHWPEYVRAVLAAADALALDRFCLLGHSLGAGIASMVAAARPERIERLWLIEGLGLLGDDGTHTLQRFRDAMAVEPAGKRLRTFASVEQAISARTLATGLPADQARPIIERAVRAVDGGWQWRSDPRINRPTPMRLAETQIHALLAGIEAPTRLLLAEPATSYLPSGPMQQRAECVRDIRVTHLAGGHHLQLEHPESVADWISGRK